MSEPIRARIFRDQDGVDCCEAEGITARHNAPVLELCRLLIRAGLDPSRPLEAFRGPMLCLTVSSIGWGAKHTVSEVPGIRLRRWEPYPTPRQPRP